MRRFEPVDQDPWQARLLVRCNCGGDNCGDELVRVYRDGESFVFRGKGRGILLDDGNVKVLSGTRLSPSQPVPPVGALPTTREQQAKIRAASQHVVSVTGDLLGDFVYEVHCEHHGEGDRRVAGDTVAKAGAKATRLGRPVRIYLRMFSMTLPRPRALSEGGSTTP